MSGFVFCAPRFMLAAMAVVPPLVLTAGPATANIPLTLPEVDHLNFFVEWECTLPTTDLRQRCRDGYLPRGWGFETSFRRGRDEVAVGFEQIDLGAAVNGYQVFGSVRVLPSLAYYRIHSDWFYTGVGAGLMELKHARLYDEANRPVPMAGSSFGLLWFGAGLTYDVPGLHGIRGDLEVAYQVRYFPSVEYTLPELDNDDAVIEPYEDKVLPAQFPRSVFMPGPQVAIGIEIPFGKVTSPVAGKRTHSSTADGTRR